MEQASLGEQVSSSLSPNRELNPCWLQQCCGGLMHEEENREVTIVLLGVVCTPYHRTGKAGQTFDCAAPYTLNTLPGILTCVQLLTSVHSTSVCYQQDGNSSAAVGEQDCEICLLVMPQIFPTSKQKHCPSSEGPVEVH